MHRPFIALAVLTFAAGAFAQPTPRNAAGPAPKDEAPANADSKYSLTIYSTADAATFDPARIAAAGVGANEIREPLPGYAVVREVRRVELAAGRNTVKFSDVAAGIDATTVSFKSLTAPDTTRVLEQNYEYDLVSPDKLLEKYVGKSVIINRKSQGTDADRARIPDTIEGRLLSFTADQFVMQTNNKQLPVQIIPRNTDIQEVKLFELQTGLKTRPTLVWQIDAQQAGPHDVLVTYQTDNLTWRADYGLTLSADQKSAELAAWVSVVNESGASYPGTRVKLVAGDVRRLRRDQPQAMLFGGRGGAGGAAADEGFKEKSFFEYHLYTLDRATSLAHNSTKQIELFPRRPGVPVERQYIYNGAREPFRGYGPAPLIEPAEENAGNTKIDVALKFLNTEKSGLGLPLPAGRVRVYHRDPADLTDPAGAAEFIGEDAIDHTPKDEPVMVRVGQAFDIVGARKATDFQLDDNRRAMTETFEITIKNHKTEAVRVVVRETLSRAANWAITSAEKFDKRDAHTIEFPVDVPAGGEKKITYAVKYTW